jgi:hypothetical protein
MGGAEKPGGRAAPAGKREEGRGERVRVRFPRKIRALNPRTRWSFWLVFSLSPLGERDGVRGPSLHPRVRVRAGVKIKI